MTENPIISQPLPECSTPDKEAMALRPPYDAALAPILEKMPAQMDLDVDATRKSCEFFNANTILSQHPRLTHIEYTAPSSETDGHNFQLAVFINNSIKQYTDHPFERDFVVSVRLNYLHVIFLLRRLELDCLAEPNDSLIEVSVEMLKLVVEAVVLRDELSNSGTRLSWKVWACTFCYLSSCHNPIQIAHYGLPAAGILAFLHAQNAPQRLQVSRSRILQDLAVLAAEIERGSVVRVEDPNYKLLTKATLAIHRFLDFVHSGLSNGIASQIPDEPQDIGRWGLHMGQDLIESWFSFWQGIADHPTLFSPFLLPADEELGGQRSTREIQVVFIDVYKDTAAIEKYPNL